MNKKQKKFLKDVFAESEPSPVEKFRLDQRQEGFELIDITQLCEFKLGISGWCHEINEPDQHIYHVQVWYRDSNIAIVNGGQAYVIDEDRYTIFSYKCCNDPTDYDFVIFAKVPVK